MTQINENMSQPFHEKKRRAGKVSSESIVCAERFQPTLSAEEANSLAFLLSALANPVRLRILHILAEQVCEVCVCDINTQFELDQSTISHHLALLRRAGIIDSVRHGVWAYYFLRSDTLVPIRQFLAHLFLSFNN